MHTTQHTKPVCTTENWISQNAWASLSLWNVISYVNTVAIIIQQSATEYSLFQSVNCSTRFGWYFTHHQELITLYLQHLALMRLVLLPFVSSRPATFMTGSSTSLINARCCRYSVMSSWWWVKYHLKHVQQLIDWNKLYSVASCWINIAILYNARSMEHKIYVNTPTWF